jgi:thioredoxin reductase
LLLLATGLRDELPQINGAARYYGKGVFHCPYCDGWEHRDEPWLVWAGSAAAATEVCLRLLTWTRDVSLLTAYTGKLGNARIQLLKLNGVKLVPGKIKELHGKSGRLRSVEFEDGRRLPCAALFFSNHCAQQSELARQLGCDFNRKGQVRTNRLQQTRVAGLFAAGDMARDMELIVIAAAEGAKAAVAMNALLNRSSRRGQAAN